MSRLEIQTIPARDIAAFAASALEDRSAQVLPISAPRAAAWAVNPEASPSDATLLVSYDGAKCVGYLGLVPAALRVNGVREQLDWLSAFFVAPEARESGLGQRLVDAAVATGRNLAAVAPADKAQTVFLRAGFHEPGKLPYFVLDFDALNLPRRAARRGAAALGLHAPNSNSQSRVWDSMRGSVCRILQRSLRQHVPPFRTRRLEAVPASAFRSDCPRRPDAYFARDTRVVDWMLRHPWTSMDRRDQLDGYYFDDYRAHFEYMLLEVSHAEHDQVLGHVVLWESVFSGMRRLHVLDYDFVDPGHASILAPLALQHAADHPPDNLFVPGVCRPTLAQSELANRFFQMRYRAYSFLPRTELAKNAQVELGYCDGDFPFA